MKKTIKILSASMLVCIMAFGMSIDTNNVKKNSNVDLLNFSLKSAQADGEGGDHNHGPTKNPLFGAKYCGNTNAYSCLY